VTTTPLSLVSEIFILLNTVHAILNSFSSGVSEFLYKERVIGMLPDVFGLVTEIFPLLSIDTLSLFSARV
jgi:hypothetical protein